MTKPYRTLILWLLWTSTATLIFLTLYNNTNLLDFLGKDTSKITWIIIGLFSVGVLGSLFLTVFVTRESLEICYQEKRAQELGLMGLSARGKRKRVANRFFDGLKVLAASNESPDLESLITIDYAFYLRMSQAIEVLGNLLITLGLIGTVMGLTLTLSGLSTSLEALGTNQDMLLSGLKTAMSGMGTAFYATLLGAVMGGVLLRIFALITDNGISSINEHLMKVCLLYLSADFKPTVERDVRYLNVEIEALASRMKALEAAFRESSSAVGEFKSQVKDLYQLSGDDQGVYTLRETLKMQRFYRVLLRQELQLMYTLNRSWWTRFKEYLQSKKD